MKSKLLSLALALSASLSIGSITAKPTVEPVQQNHVTQTKSITLSCDNLVNEETNPENTQKDSAKPERKKPSTAGKIFYGFMVALTVTIVVFLLTVRGNE